MQASILDECEVPILFQNIFNLFHSFMPTFASVANPFLMKLLESQLPTFAELASNKISVL